MGFSFNPVKEHDWQGLNILLEKLFYGGTVEKKVIKTTPLSTRENVKTVVLDESEQPPDSQEMELIESVEVENAEIATKQEQPSKKSRFSQLFAQNRIDRLTRKQIQKRSIPVSTTKNKRVILLDSTKEYPDGEPKAEMTELTGVVDDFGINIQVKNTSDQYANLHNQGKVFLTPAGMSVPSSYFLDLRGIEDSLTTRQFTADYLVVRDNSSPAQTIGLANVDETNDISISGPTPGGRDQSSQFTSQWIHLFIIYNPFLQLVSSLSSLSATAPTLPTDYDFFMRVGSAYINAAHQFQGPDSQMGEVHYYRSAYSDMEPAVDDTYENLSISGAVPSTAKAIFGYFGLSQDVLVKKGMAVASDTSASNQCIATLLPGTLVSGYVPSNAIYFTLPLITSQQISWKGSPKDPDYAIIIQGYIDDL